MNRSSRDSSTALLMIRLGVVLILTVALGFGLGFLLDTQVGTKPLLTLICSVLGMASGSWLGYRLVADEIEKITLAAELARQSRQTSISAAQRVEE